MWINRIIGKWAKAEGLKRASLRSAEAMGTVNRPLRPVERSEDRSISDSLNRHYISKGYSMLDLCNSTVPYYIQHHSSYDENQAEQDE
jgi:hypothetical protein